MGCTRTPLLNPNALQGRARLSVTPCHTDILPWETRTGPSSEGMATGGTWLGCVGWMEKNLLGRVQGLSARVQHPGKGLKGNWDVIASLEIPARMRQEMPGHLPWHDRSPASLDPVPGASPGSVGKDGRILAPAGEAGAGRHGSQQRAGENKSLLQR